MRFPHFLKFIAIVANMLTGNFIVKQSKFLLFITILYLKDLRHVHDNPIFDIDLDLISDLVSLSEDWINLQRRYDNSNEKSKCYLPQNKWVINFEDIHLNYTQLIKKYGIPEEDSEEHENKYYVLSRDSEYDTRMYPASNWLISVFKVGLAYLVVCKGYDLWMDNVRGIKRIAKEEHRSPSNSVFWNFSRDEIGGFKLPVLIGIIVNLSEYEEILYPDTWYKITSANICSKNASFIDKLTLTVVISAMVWVFRLLRILHKLVFLLYDLICIFNHVYCKSNIIGSKSIPYFKKSKHQIIELKHFPLQLSDQSYDKCIPCNKCDNRLAVYEPNYLSYSRNPFDFIAYNTYILLICKNNLQKITSKLFNAMMRLCIIWLRTLHDFYNSQIKEIKVYSRISELFQSCTNKSIS